AFLVGFLFSIGLAVSGMTQPQKVIGFLDLTGNWDPSLMFVMLGAIPVHFLSYLWIKGKPSPVFDTKWHYPTNKTIDKFLIGGSALFGVGWGLGGYCPGPALASVLTGKVNVLVFVLTMTLGMLVWRLLDPRTRK
ncbi:MAG: YeeE/YedE family protein, partial [Bdellovibrionaceae bacterium]|nr:YeeE/YedE family protein [Pseudobdellovibrionaceae bacterium]